MKNYIIILSIISSAFAQFGQNKVQYTDFQWRFIQSKHFDIYFYKGGEATAEFTAEVTEEFYQRVKLNWNYKLKKRIPLFVYNSHNDFKQSLIVGSYLPESIGGVTELFKNRIIVPFEGDYMKFAHVIRHELVHGIMNDYLYDASIQSVISRRVSQPPLWFSEGLAEWESTGWSPRHDMVVRDMILNNTLPPIQYLQYVSPYQGGANVFKYISERFGREKVAELLRKTRSHFSFNTAFESAIQLSPEQFTEDWHLYLRREYWPEIENKKEPNEISARLSNHSKDRSYINNGAVISPKGDKIAYLSNKSDGYMSIYLIDSFSGKEIKRLLKGGTSDKFDQMHFLSPGLSFSPDGKKLAFASFAGEKDLLNIIDIESEETKSFSFDVDGLYSPAYSPDGGKIAFSGIKHGSSDIYIYDLKTKKLTNLTNDVYSDLTPTWSNAGEEIAFVSDRGDHTKTGTHPFDFKMFNYKYEFKDIYTINLANEAVTRITNTEDADEASPTFSADDKILAFTSNRSGINNIYFKNLDTNEAEYPVTNLISGAFQLDWSKDNQQLVYSSFYKSGYDVYSISNPSNLKAVSTQKTHFANTKSASFYKTLSAVSVKDSIAIKENQLNEGKDYSRYNFANVYRKKRNKQPKEKKREEIFLKEDDVKKDGKYKVRDYDEDWSVDFVNGVTSYDNIYGLTAFYTLLLSEKSGKERINILSNLVFNFQNADILVQYAYLPKQINYAFTLFHLSNRFGSSGRVYTYRNFGFGATASLPFSRFKRFDLTAQLVKYELTDNLGFSSTSSEALIGTTSYVYDNSKASYTGPSDGMRYNITGVLAPELSDHSAAFVTFKFDFRKYFELTSGFSLAIKTAFGTSYGLREKNGLRSGQQTFRIGGVSYWLFNTKYKNNSSTATSRNPDINQVQEISYTEFITPLRGAYYNEQNGRNFAVTNFEFRFPFIDYLITRIPPLPLQGIRGSFFLDMGTAFNNFGPLRAFKDGKPNDLIVGYGFGIQAYIPIFGGLARFDKAWRAGPEFTEPIYYFSFGLDF